MGSTNGDKFCYARILLSESLFNDPCLSRERGNYGEDSLIFLNLKPRVINRPEVIEVSNNPISYGFGFLIVNSARTVPTVLGIIYFLEKEGMRGFALKLVSAQGAGRYQQAVIQQIITVLNNVGVAPEVFR